MTLKLEYSCTEAEMQEAKTLQEHQYYGRGSKWRARLVLGGLLALMLACAYLRFKHEMTPLELFRVAYAGLDLVHDPETRVRVAVGFGSSPGDAGNQVEKIAVVLFVAWKIS